MTDPIAYETAVARVESSGPRPAPRRPGTPADTAPDDGLREQLVAAIRAATCTGRDQCGETEEECGSKRIQPAVWHFGELAEVTGTPGMFADAVQPVITRHTQQLRADLTEAERDLAQAEADRAQADADGQRAEATLERVREVPAFVEEVIAASGPGVARSAVRAIADRLRAALDQPETGRA